MDKLHGQANMYPIQYHDGLFSLETDIFMSFFFKTWFGQYTSVGLKYMYF